MLKIAVAGMLTDIRSGLAVIHRILVFYLNFVNLFHPCSSLFPDIKMNKKRISSISSPCLNLLCTEIPHKDYRKLFCRVLCRCKLFRQQLMCGDFDGFCASPSL